MKFFITWYLKLLLYNNELIKVTEFIGLIKK